MHEEQYEVTADIPLRFRDLDAMGHVNNSVFATYLEMARVEYYRQMVGIQKPTDFEMVIAHISIDYLAPIHLSDRVTASIRVGDIGQTSFVFEYILHNADTGIPYARARSVQVGYDFKAEKKKPIGAWRDQVARFKAERLGPSSA